MTANNVKFYTEREEIANYMSHAVGIVMAIACSVVLVRKSLVARDLSAMFAYVLFGFGMFSCMLSSTLYHYTNEAKRKAKLRHFDHASIYLLIASSYTPFTLILLRDNAIWMWSIFIAVWIMAAVGMYFSFQKLKKNSHLKTISYVAMGLAIVVAMKPLLETANANNSMQSVYWLFIGGAFYIIGSVFYALAKREFIHTVFHVFVLLGLASHIYAAYLLPLGQ